LGHENLETHSDVYDASAVVIAKNAEETIGKCIESLLQQTIECEIIVVDGHSTDRTREIVKQFPVKLVEAPPRDTYGISRNLGVQHAQGQIILFQDADDSVEPTWCESLVRHFRHDPRLGIIIGERPFTGSHSWFINLLHNRLEKPPRETGEAHHEKYNVARDAAWHEVSTKGSAFLRKAIIEAGSFDEDMFFGSEDKELAYRIVQKGYKVVYDPRIMIYCKPTNGVKEYLKDKFCRAGMGHGYIRRKHRVYRPPFTGIGSLILLLLSVVLWGFSIYWAFLSLTCALLLVYGLIREAISHGMRHERLRLAPAFFMVRWGARVLEFMGFAVTFLIPVKYLRRINELFQ